MAAQEMIASNKEGAEIFYEDVVCRQEINLLLIKHGLPTGLMPVKDVIEFGYNKNTGFLWVKQLNKIEHRFTAIHRNAIYDMETSGFIEDRRMRKITGVKAKKMLIWVPIGEFCVDDNNPDKLDFISPFGPKKTFPVSAFELPK